MSVAKYKELPVYINDRQITRVSEKPPAVTRCYHAVKRLYAVHKIHHLKGRKFIVDTKDDKRLNLVL
jgi:hypothetical protein